jgi:RNA polymerase sigma-70 factor (ECF subfamily)
VTEPLQKRFEENRPHLRRVAWRMLGSLAEAEDAVQETWLRLARTDVSAVDNLAGWLVTVIGRVCLDMLRSRGARREERLSPAADAGGSHNPEAEAALADSLGPALLVVLETLTPAERVAFVLHDLFELSFDEIASIVGRTPEAARQLASRARRRVRGVGEPATADPERQRVLVDAFLAASRGGDFDALVAVLAPDAVLHADPLVVRTAREHGWGGTPELPAEAHGAVEVASVLRHRTRGVQPARLDGLAGLVWVLGGQVRSAFVFTVENDKIARVDLVMEPERLAALDVEL